MFDLTDKKALITGASGGIGSAIADILHKRGAEVMLAGRREDVLQAKADSLGERAHVGVANLDDRQALQNLVKHAQDKMERIDILVNNAGQTRDNLALRLSDEAWDEVIELDLTSGFLLARACLRGMIKRRWGRIISITSVVGWQGNIGQANYAAAKAGLTAMSKSLAKEGAKRGVCVNCVAPGFIETAMTDDLSDDQREQLRTTIAMERFGASTDIAYGVAFLASEEASYITGQTLHINGGMVMV